MTNNNYKAFISYSHRDESWAKWLHKALESYRIPKRLRGPSIPEKLYPVFRDRDELSSAADLSEKVQEAMKASENLIVICSPASARSRWVNEEIRLFRSLGREDRIFPLIVDGEPQAQDPDQECFPPALTEGVAENREPLAADARAWADGKALAKLKLISGMLNIRLDELRMREQRRRRQTQFAWSLAALAALALVFTAVVSRVEERVQRQQSERFVSELVEFSKGLNAQVDLETLKNFATTVQGYLDNTEPGDLTAESSEQVALVLRQLGVVSKAQGQLEESMQAFEQSRNILAGLVEQYPENLGYIHELGNAEFYVASVHMETLDYESAEKALFNYRELARRLESAEPGNPAWIMEMSYVHTNLAVLAQRSGKNNADAAMAHMETSVGYIERALELEPGNVNYQSEYVGALSWLADAQLRVCDLDGARTTRQKNEAMARELRNGSPGNNDLKRDHAYALAGLAAVLKNTGMIDLAAKSSEEAKDLLDELVLLDPSNDKYRWEALRRAAYIADLDSDTGRLDTALDAMGGLREGFILALNANEDGNLRRQSQFAKFLLDYSDASIRSGDSEMAAQLLDEAISILQAVLEKNENHRASLEHVGRAAFLWRQLHEEEANPVLERYSLDLLDSPGNTRSCYEANLAARQAILKGNRGAAIEYSNYLLDSGYFDPDFRWFCKSNGLCE